MVREALALLVHPGRTARLAPNPWPVRAALLGLGFLFLLLVVVLPLVAVFTQAFEKGIGPTSRRCRNQKPQRPSS
jgi:ABC-type sulfate transport system permease subunit